VITVGAFTLNVDNRGRIEEIHSIRNPQKLRHVRLP
jgi:hypothetical protein